MEIVKGGVEGLLLGVFDGVVDCCGIGFVNLGIDDVDFGVVVCEEDFVVVGCYV